MNAAHNTAAKHWNAPVLGQLKLNSDASFIQDAGKTTLGVIVRDHEGNVVSSCMLHNIFPDALETDFVAVSMVVNAEEPNLSSLCYVYREIARLRKT